MRHADATAHLVDRVAGAHQGLDLRHGDAVVFVGAEGDHAGKDVALGRHEGKGLGVGENNQDAGGDGGTARPTDVEQRDIPRFDLPDRAIKAIAIGPEVGKLRLPDLDQRLRCNVAARKLH